MTCEQFERERRYSVAMSIVHEMLDTGILMAKEVRQIETILAKKYLPAIARLFA